METQPSWIVTKPVVCPVCKKEQNARVRVNPGFLQLGPPVVKCVDEKCPGRIQVLVTEE